MANGSLPPLTATALPVGLHASLSSFPLATPASSAPSTPSVELPSFLPEVPFSTRLRLATVEAHASALLPSLVGKLVSGELPQDLHLRYLMILHRVYSALESALDAHSTHPNLCGIYNPALLARKGALESDCVFYTGCREWRGSGVWREWEEEPREVREYVERVREVGEGEGTKLLAHAYVRYLGDLSGGQQIARTLRRAYALPPTGEGGAFYEFYLPPPSASHSSLPTSSSAQPERAGGAETKAIKAWLREGLDEAGRQMTAVQRDEVVEEAKRAFELNVGVFRSFEEAVKALEQEEGEKVRVKVVKKADLVPQKTGMLTWTGVVVALGLALYLGWRDTRWSEA